MKLGMFTCGYQYYPLERAFADAKRFGYDYIELWGGRPHAFAPDLASGGLAEVRALPVTEEVAEALEVQRSLIPLRSTFRYGNPNTMIKYAANLLGYPVGNCRAPFNSISPEGIAALKDVLEAGKEAGME